MRDHNYKDQVHRIIYQDSRLHGRLPYHANHFRNSLYNHRHHCQPSLSEFVTIRSKQMSRKGVGLAAFDRSRITSAQYASHGSNLRSSHSTSLATQLSVFRSLLQQFAQTHAKDIRSNPTFRAEFARMCSAIGVDPLASSNNAGGKNGGGSFWAQMLGTSVNDFYFELAVRVVEVCGATREENGGLIGVKEVKDRIMSTRMEGSTEISEYVEE